MQDGIHDLDSWVLPPRLELKLLYVWATVEIKIMKNMMWVGIIPQSGAIGDLILYNQYCIFGIWGGFKYVDLFASHPVVVIIIIIIINNNNTHGEFSSSTTYTLLLTITKKKIQNIFSTWVEQLGLL
jgi:hypothetical protein